MFHYGALSTHSKPWIKKKHFKAESIPYKAFGPWDKLVYALNIHSNPVSWFTYITHDTSMWAIL